MPQKANISDAERIARFQVDMAAESEGATLNREIVLKGVTEGLKDKSKGQYMIVRNDDGLACITDDNS
jgi:hypothetical protein